MSLNECYFSDSRSLTTCNQKETQYTHLICSWSTFMGKIDHIIKVKHTFDLFN